METSGSASSDAFAMLALSNLPRMEVTIRNEQGPLPVPGAELAWLYPLRWHNRGGDFTGSFFSLPISLSRGLLLVVCASMYQAKPLCVTTPCGV